jgi:hypothetical protein
MSQHDNESRIASDAILEQIRLENPYWLNPFVSKNVHYVSSTQKFPSPDRSFYCPDKYTRIAIEFKPAVRESKGGILRGLGQVMAYLMKHPDNNIKLNDASYLVMPDIIDDFQIGDFLQNIFDQYIVGVHPIGLVTFNTNDPSMVKLRRNISNQLESTYDSCYQSAIKEGKSDADAIESARKRSIRGREKNVGGKTYWAAWRENYPHDTYYLLKTALKNQSIGTKRVDEIWEEFYYSYYCYPPETKDTLDLLDNKLFTWDKDNNFVNGKWAPSLKTSLKKSVEQNLDTLDNAIARLHWASSKNKEERSKYWLATQKLSKKAPHPTKVGLESSDNDYNTIKKNRRNGMSHIGIWDNNTFEVTYLGEMYVKMFEEIDPISALATMYIGSGKWDELIQDILDYQENNEIPKEVSEYRENLKEYFVSRGLIGLNRERKSQESENERPFLTSETQALKKYLIYEGFEPEVGFVFNTSKLKEVKGNFTKFSDIKTRLIDSIENLSQEKLSVIESMLEKNNIQN